jgi:HK97 gp10 family phage protein
VKLKIDGLEEIQAALRELPKATAKGVIRRVLLKRAQPIVNDARQKAPVKTGRLRDSITARVRTGGGAGKAAFAEAMRQGASRAEAGQAARAANRAAGGAVEVLIGPTKDTFYGHLVEFGTEHSAPAPFMRPAWDANKMNVLQGVKDDLWDETKRVVARRAKRLAKAAAKAGG